MPKTLTIWGYLADIWQTVFIKKVCYLLFLACF